MNFITLCSRINGEFVCLGVFVWWFAVVCLLNLHLSCFSTTMLVMLTLNSQRLSFEKTWVIKCSGKSFDIWHRFGWWHWRSPFFLLATGNHIQLNSWLYLSQVQVFKKLCNFSSYTLSKISCIRSKNRQISSSALKTEIHMP